MRWLDGITHSMDMSLMKLREIVMDREACLVCCSSRSHRVGHNLATELTFVSGRERQNCASFNFFINSIFASKVQKIILLCQIEDILEERHSES